MAHAGDIGHHPQRHAEPGKGKAEMPAERRRQPARDERRHERADVDHHVIDLERIGRARIARGIKRAHLRAQVAAKQPRAGDDQRQRDQERGIERQQEMPRGHRDPARHHRHPARQQPIPQPAPGDRREKGERAVEPEDFHRERFDRQRAGDALDRVAKRGQPDHLPYPIGPQQFARHVQRQHRLHAVERYAIPEFGPRHDPHARRMAPDLAVRRRRGEIGQRFRDL